ncbi:essential nuclear protein 1 [Nematocida sp. ERTm5]|nr:essential nuclear protein 1 [Nematocida sp. ERTm5]
MGIGQEIMAELMNDEGYFLKLDRNSEEIAKIEEELRTGTLPSIFKLHSHKSVIAPHSAEDYLELLLVIDIKQAQVKVLKEIVERVMSYPLAYYQVKKRVTELLREKSMEYIRKHKKLEISLFKAHVMIMSRCSKAYFSGMIKPLCDEGMSNNIALILSRVIMKCTCEKGHMEDMLRNIMVLERTHSVYILITAILIKGIRFSQDIIDDVHQYILDELQNTSTRYLAWNKVVLVFIRNYKNQVDTSLLIDIYREPTSPIEIEILKELNNEKTE